MTRRRGRRSDRPRPSRRHAPSRVSSCIPTWAGCGPCSTTWPAGWRRTASRSARSSRSPTSPPNPSSPRSSSASRHVKELDDAQQLEIFSSAADLLVVEDNISRVSRARLLHGRPLHVQGGGRATASTPRSPSTACCARPTTGRARGTRSSRSRSPIACARRSRSSARSTSARRRPTSTRCAPRGRAAPTARS